MVGHPDAPQRFGARSRCEARGRVGLNLFVALMLATGALIAPPAAAAQSRSAAAAPGTNALEALFFGDVMVERRLEPTIAERGMAYLLDGVRRLPDGRTLDDFALVSANLEGAVTDGGAKSEPEYPFDFAFPPERIESLVDGGISFFTISNNHTWDQGWQGVTQTRRHLTEIGVPFVGDVDSRVSDDSVAVFEWDGVRVAMVGVSEVYRMLSDAALDELVRAADAAADITVVNIHWGREYEHVPFDLQLRRARSLAASGADLIIGHHPHVIQGLEIVDGVPVIYSHGNFLFDQAFNDRVQEGMATRVEFARAENGRVVVAELEFLPYRAVDYQPRWATGALRTRMLDEIAEWSLVDETVREQIRSGSVVIR